MITISLWEIDVILWFQSLGDWLKPVMLFFTQLGHPAAYLLIISFLYWGVDSKLGQRIAVFTLFSGITNVIIKWLLHAPRPYWVDARIRPIGNASTAFGFPSGHAQTSLAWTMIGRGSFKWRGRAVLFAGIVLIGISRVYLGVHSPFQVLIGWLLGILLMIAYWRLERPAVHWLTSKPFPLQMFVVSIITVFILLLGWFSAWLLRDWTIPRLWMQNVMPYLNEGELFNPLDFDDVVIFAAGFSGMALGMILMTQGGGCPAGGKLAARSLRILTGTIILLLSFLVLTFFGEILRIEEQSVIIAWLWQFFTVFMIFFLIFYPIPMLFRRLRLSCDE